MVKVCLDFWVMTHSCSGIFLPCIEGGGWGKNEVLRIYIPVRSVCGNCRLVGGSACAPPCRLLTTRFQKFSGHSVTQLEAFLSTSSPRYRGWSSFYLGSPPRALTSHSQSSLLILGLAHLHHVQSCQSHFQPQLPVLYPSLFFVGEEEGILIVYYIPFQLSSLFMTKVLKDSLHFGPFQPVPVSFLALKPQWSYPCWGHQWRTWN